MSERASPLFKYFSHASTAQALPEDHALPQFIPLTATPVEPPPDPEQPLPDETEIVSQPKRGNNYHYWNNQPESTRMQIVQYALEHSQARALRRFKKDHPCLNSSTLWDWVHRFRSGSSTFVSVRKTGQ